MILPSYYNHDGESFLYTALIHRNKTIAKLLACGLTAKGLALPLWFTGGKVGPSALDIALSDDIVVTRDAPWDDSEEYGKPHFDHRTFMYAVLKKHPRKREIEPAYLAQFNRKSNYSQNHHATANLGIVWTPLVPATMNTAAQE